MHANDDRTEGLEKKEIYFEAILFRGSLQWILEKRRQK